MAKRKYAGSTATIPPSKRAKLDASTCDDIRATAPLPAASSRTTLNQPEKRKRTEPSQTDSPEDLHRSKRARISDSSSILTKSRPGSSPVAWPNIEEADVSSDEELDEIAREFRESCSKASEMGTEGLYGYRRHISYQNPLPSPTPSDRDTIEDDADEYPTTANSLPKFQKMPSPRPQVASPNRTLSRGGNSKSRLRSREDDATLIHQQPRSKRQPHQKRREKREEKERKEKKERKQRKDGSIPLRDANSSPAVQGFLSSTRSSRRNPECELWYLGDDGKAYVR